MKKIYLTVALVSALIASMGLSSCIGSFALTNKVLSWNNQVGNKFVNELVFFAFWVLPVYEVTALADVLVINSIEFWSGSNPMAMGTKVIDTESGRYLVKCDGKGYDVTDETNGRTTRLDFSEETRTWSVETQEGDMIPFMTFVDQDHVKMIAADGGYVTVELSQAGVMAYSAQAASGLFAKN